MGVSLDKSRASLEKIYISTGVRSWAVVVLFVGGGGLPTPLYKNGLSIPNLEHFHVLRGALPRAKMVPSGPLVQDTCTRAKLVLCDLKFLKS